MPSEQRVILRHSLTILWGQWAVMLFGIVDAVAAGHYDTTALAGLAVGSSVYITVYVVMMAILQALLPLFSEQVGAQQPRRVGHLFRQSLALWALVSLLGSGLLHHPEPLLAFTQTPADAQLHASEYLAIMAWTLPAVLLFRIYASLSQSIGNPQLVSWIQMAGLGLKLPLAFGLTFGLWGFPEWGLSGCALSTLIIQWGMAITALWRLRQHPLFKPFQLWRGQWRLDPKTLFSILRLGVPNGITSGVEVTSFTLMALFIARLGAGATASHQVAASLAAFLFMVPMAFSIATSARLSYWIGAGQQHNAWESVKAGYTWVISLGLVAATLLALLHHEIARLFSTEPQVMEMAGGLLVLVALYHLGDGLQVMGYFLLRSLKITLLPMVIYVTLLWGLGLWGGHRLAYGGLGLAPLQHPQAFWISSAMAVMISGLALGLILRHVFHDSTQWKVQGKA
jgi:MATE family multidrug resistance protein